MLPDRDPYQNSSGDGSKARRPRRTSAACSRTTIAQFSALTLVVGTVLWLLSDSAIKKRESEMAAVLTGDDRQFDCVIVPGGGLGAAGQPLPWVAARLDAALKHESETAFFLVLSRGTTHKPPPLDSAGFPVDESAASARYLVERGVDPSRVLLESWSCVRSAENSLLLTLHRLSPPRCFCCSSSTKAHALTCCRCRVPRAQARHHRQRGVCAADALGHSRLAPPPRHHIRFAHGAHAEDIQLGLRVASGA